MHPTLRADYSLWRNFLFGVAYYAISQRFSLLCKTSLKIQTTAFAVTGVIQCLYIFKLSPKQNKPLKTLAPTYLVIGFLIYYGENKYAKTAMNTQKVFKYTLGLGTVQGIIGQTSYENLPPINRLDPHMNEDIVPLQKDSNDSFLCMEDIMYPNDSLFETHHKRIMTNLQQHLITDISDIIFDKLIDTNWEVAFPEQSKTLSHSVPPLPIALNKILNLPCPFWGNKTVRDTHALVLIYPMSVRELLDMISKEEGFDISIIKPTIIGDEDWNRLMDSKPDKSYWALITKNTIPGSYCNSSGEKRALLQDQPYQLPKLVEIITSLYLHSKRTRRLLFQTPWPVCLCEETVNDGDHISIQTRFLPRRLSVRNGKATGLLVAANHYIHGMAAIRRLPLPVPI